MQTKSIAASGLLFFACSAFALPCVTNDAWTGPDKTKHLAVGFAIGAAGERVTKNPLYGFALGAAVGVAKEAWDRPRANHSCSLQDAAVTALGSAAGAYGTHWLFLPRRDGVQVAYIATF